MLRSLLPLLTVWIAGCAELPQTADPGGLLSARSPGPHTVGRHGPAQISDPSRDAPFEYVIYYPESPGRYPLVVFSHGSRCDADHNDPLSRHWASHGFIVVQPRHLDAAPASFDGSLDPAEVWSRRRADMRLAVDRIDAVLAQVQWSGRRDPALTVAAGHSYGGLTAQATGGAQTGRFDDSGGYERFSDDRYDVILAIAPPGPMGSFVTAETGRLIDKPMLVVVGTEDFYPPLWSTWETHRVTYDSASAGDQYLAVIEGADHRYGGLICNANDDPEQPELLEKTAAVTTLFLQARDQERAREAFRRLAEGVDRETGLVMESR